MKDPSIERRANCYKFFMTFNTWYRKLPYDVVRNIIQRLSLFDVLNVYSFTMDEKMIDACGSFFLKACQENNLPLKNFKPSFRFLQFLRDVGKGIKDPEKSQDIILPSQPMRSILVTFRKYHSDYKVPVKLGSINSVGIQDAEIELTYGDVSTPIKEMRKDLLSGIISSIRLHDTTLYYVKCGEPLLRLSVHQLDLLSGKSECCLNNLGMAPIKNQTLFCTGTHLFLTCSYGGGIMELSAVKLQKNRVKRLKITPDFKTSQVFAFDNELLILKDDGVFTYELENGCQLTERFFLLGQNAFPTSIAGKGYIWIWHDDIWYYSMSDRQQRIIGKTTEPGERPVVLSQHFFQIGNTSYYFNEEEAINVTEWTEMNRHVFTFVPETAF